MSSLLDTLRQSINNDQSLMVDGPRTSRKKSYTLLGEKLGISYATLHRFMDKGESLQLSTIEVLCNHYGLGLGPKPLYAADPTKDPITLNSGDAKLPKVVSHMDASVNRFTAKEME